MTPSAYSLIKTKTASGLIAETVKFRPEGPRTRIKPGAPGTEDGGEVAGGLAALTHEVKDGTIRPRTGP